MKTPAHSHLPHLPHLRAIAAALAVCAVVTLSQCSADSARSGADGDGAIGKSQTAQQVAAEAPKTVTAEKSAAESSGQAIAVAAADFGKFLKTADGVVLVDFWAEWCQPCHVIAPEIDKVAAKYAGRVQVVKVDLSEDAGEGFSAKYGVDFLPTVVIFKDGRPQGNLVINGRPMPDANGISASLDKQL